MPGSSPGMREIEFSRVYSIFKQPSPFPRRFRPEAWARDPFCTRRGMERRLALHLVRALRGARCPEPRALALRRSTAAFAKSRRTWLNPGPRFLGRGHFCPVPVQRAPRRAVLVPPGRGPGVARVRGYEPRPREPIPIPRRTRRATRPSWIETAANLMARGGVLIDFFEEF